MISNHDNTSKYKINNTYNPQNISNAIPLQAYPNIYRSNKNIDKSKIQRKITFSDTTISHYFLLIQIVTAKQTTSPNTN